MAIQPHRIAPLFVLLILVLGCSGQRAADEGQVDRTIETAPVLIGGLEGLYERVVYPESARLAGIEGRVIVRFVVDTTGVPGRFEVMQSLCEECDQAVIDAISQSRFIPGTQRGVPVFVRYDIPVTFRLTDD